MILNDFVDPNEAALAQVGGILGKLSGPSRMPTNLGSILGQAGAVGMATRQQVGMQNEQLAQTRMLREQQASEMQERVRSRQEAMAERQKAEQSQVQFRSLLAESDDPSDPINVLGAGMRSGALNAQQYSTLLSNVQERQAARQQRMDELRLRLSAEERQAERDEQAKIRAEDLRRELQANQQVFQRDQQRLIASLRPSPATSGSAQGKAPSGYQWSESKPGTLEPIPGGPATVMTPEAAAKVELLENGLKDVGRFRELVIKGGKPDRKLLTLMNVPGGGAPGSDSRMAYSYIYNAVEAKLRAESGAAVPETEVKRMASRFIPGPLDNDATIADRIDRLEEFLGGAKWRTKAGSGSPSPTPAPKQETSMPWNRNYNNGRP